MQTALCGKTPCPRLCTRVCHCPAGLARSHWLAGAYRNRRQMSQAQASRLYALSPAYQQRVEFISPALHNFGSLNQPQHGSAQKTFPTHEEPPYRPASSPVFHGRRSWRWGLAIILLAAIFITTAILTATPPEYEWVWEHGQFIWQEK